MAQVSSRPRRWWTRVRTPSYVTRRRRPQCGARMLITAAFQPRPASGWMNSPCLSLSNALGAPLAKVDGNHTS